MSLPDLRIPSIFIHVVPMKDTVGNAAIEINFMRTILHTKANAVSYGS